ncbi:hypothetical protein [Ruminiclostridium herbifermentans]|uniref:hypothetical protein n=1 Tax=Ruminiclostridium herbifermentans TaxID=2488810 RepID=UPI0010FA2ADF|nr:hypothetical protein [Ruminiclostridium herbifermentans]
MLNRNGYVREKALKLISGAKIYSAIPYVLLRLNDWVLPVRQLADTFLRICLLQTTLIYLLTTCILLTNCRMC